jgi:hypothetical protein
MLRMCGVRIHSPIRLHGMHKEFDFISNTVHCDRTWGYNEYTRDMLRDVGTRSYATYRDRLRDVGTGS